MFHILVVEDDAKLRSLFCTVLTNNGYLALPAESGEKALSLLDSEYVDLIISDIMMPGMDGYELIEHLRFEWIYDADPDYHRQRALRRQAARLSGRHG